MIIYNLKSGGYPYRQSAKCAVIKQRISFLSFPAGYESSTDWKYY